MAGTDETPDFFYIDIDDTVLSQALEDCERFQSEIADIGHNFSLLTDLFGDIPGMFYILYKSHNAFQTHVSMHIVIANLFTAAYNILIHVQKTFICQML